MTQPREILRRIQRRQARRDALRGLDAPRTPAPASPSIPTPHPAPVPPPVPSPHQAAFSQSVPSPQPAPISPPAPPVQPAPSPSRPTPGHALYSELMRSHDRMGTRHLKQ